MKNYYFLGRILCLASACVFLVETRSVILPQFKRINVYNVSSCPQNTSEWREAAIRLNCSYDRKDTFYRYHCLPDSRLTSLVEFCYDYVRPLVPKGNCVILDDLHSIINSYNCTAFDNGCPDTHFDSDNIFKYPSCLSIDPNRHCFHSEKDCQPQFGIVQAGSGKNSSANANADFQSENHNAIIWLVSVFLCSFLLLSIVIICYWKQRQKVKSDINAADSQDSQDVVVEVGNTAFLKAKVVEEKLKSKKWQKIHNDSYKTLNILTEKTLRKNERTSLVNNTRYIEETCSGKIELAITNTTEADTGIYRLHLNYKLQVIKDFTFNVIVDYAPVIKIPGKTTYICGDTASMRAKVESRIRISSIKWFKVSSLSESGKEAPTEIECTERYRLINGKEELQIDKINFHDGGRYRICAVNRIGETRRDFIISVIEEKEEKISEHRNSEISKQIDSTITMVEKDVSKLSDIFVETQAFKKTKELLHTNRYVVIKGNPGVGKTTMAKQLLKLLMDKGKRPIQLFKIADLYGHVSPFENIVVFVDNVFGEFSLSRDDVADFRKMNDLIRILIENNSSDTGNYLIMTIRNDIHMELMKKIGQDTMPNKSMIDISDRENQLQYEEMALFATNYGLPDLLGKKDLMSESFELSRILGFPQCCSLARNAKIGDKIVDFLKKPLDYFESYIEKQLEEKTAKNAVLIYILLHGGQVDSEKMTSTFQDLKMKHATLKMIGLKQSDTIFFHQSINVYEDFLIKIDAVENVYKFSHSSVQVCVFRVLFQRYPVNVIEKCSSSLLPNLTTSRKPNNTQVFLPEDLFEAVISRIQNIIKEGSQRGFESIAVLDLWNDGKFFDSVLEKYQCINLIQKSKDAKDNSMLIYFTKAGNKRWVQRLLPFSDEEQKSMSLNTACAENMTDVVEMILEDGSIPNLTTCFHAVQSGNLELLTLLCKKVVNLKQTALSLHPIWNNISHGLLHEICKMGQSKLIEPILKRYEFLQSLLSNQGGTVLHAAASAGNKTAFEILLKHELNPFKKDINDHTMLTNACQNGKLEMVKYLIKHYPKLLLVHTDNFQKTLFHWAAFSGSIDMFELITKTYTKSDFFSLKGHDDKDITMPCVESVNCYGDTILHVACSEGHFEMCKYLFDKFPQLLRIENNNGFNVLHSAAKGGSIALFNLLLKKDFDAETVTNDKSTVLHISAINNNLDLSKYLFTKYRKLKAHIDDSGFTVLHSTAFGGNIDLLNFLKEHGLDIHEVSKFKENVLHVCCRGGELQMCKYLVRNYRELVHGRDDDERTVLHSAAWGGNMEIFTFLLSEQMDVKAKTKKGETVLHISCRRRNLDMCKTLINDYKQLIRMHDNTGRTVLNIAEEKGYADEICAFLRSLAL